MSAKLLKSYEWGVQAEDFAVEHLVREGYAIRERRWRQGASHFEIDIVAELPGVLVFVEVKARTPGAGEPRSLWSADPFAPAWAVDMRKRRMIVRTADSYIRIQPHDYTYRFDIITVVGFPEDYILSHITDAFLSPVFSR